MLIYRRVSIGLLISGWLKRLTYKYLHAFKSSDTCSLYFGFQCLRSWRVLKVKLWPFFFISFLLPTFVTIVLSWKIFMTGSKIHGSERAIYERVMCPLAHVCRVYVCVWVERYWNELLNISWCYLVSTFGVLGPVCADSELLGRPLSAVGSFPAKYRSLARLNSWISVARISILLRILTPGGCNTD